MPVGSGRFRDRSQDSYWVLGTSCWYSVLFSVIEALPNFGYALPPDFFTDSQNLNTSSVVSATLASK